MIQTMHNTVHCSRWVVCTCTARTLRVLSRARRALSMRVGRTQVTTTPKPGPVATPQLCRDAEHDTKNHVTTRGFLAQSILGRDTKKANPCCDTKNYVATPKTVSRPKFGSTLQLPCRDAKGHVATSQRLPLPRHENHVPTKDQPSPNLNHVVTQKLMSRPKGQEFMSCTQIPCRGRVLAL